MQIGDSLMSAYNIIKFICIVTMSTIGALFPCNSKNIYYKGVDLVYFQNYMGSAYDVNRRNVWINMRFNNVASQHYYWCMFTRISSMLTSVNRMLPSLC